ncbi:MAG: hypothetical protein RR202_06085 [Bacteroidales bacterium]
MENLRLNVICAGSGSLGGTMVACANGSVALSAGSLLEVMVYAALSALVGFGTKMALDRLMRARVTNSCQTSEDLARVCNSCLKSQKKGGES